MDALVSRWGTVALRSCERSTEFARGAGEDVWIPTICQLNFEVSVPHGIACVAGLGNIFTVASPNKVYTYRCIQVCDLPANNGFSLVLGAGYSVDILFK